MVLNAAVQMLREADELKQNILKFKSGTSMLQERSLWVTQQQLQKVYQKVLVLDLDYALEKKVEQDLWNVGFKQQIEALQAISKDRKNPLRSEGQAMLSWVLQAAAGFYLCLLHQICTTFKLDLPFRRRASLLGWVEGWGAGAGARLPPPAAARYICQHCLVHLGDLARYRQQLRVAHTFYRHALVVSVHSGQPYNQLALVAWRRGRRLAALYWHVRSLLVRAPFPPAPANLRRTLHAAASGGLSRESLPVLPGVTNNEPGDLSVPLTAPARAGRLDAHAYVNELIRAVHLIHSVDQLETAATIVDSLNSSLTALIATDSFESMTLIKMSCVLIWLVQSSNEDFKVENSALTEEEVQAAALASALAAAALLALLLPAYTLPQPPPRALPALKVWLAWIAATPAFARGAAWRARAALCPALAHTLNLLARVPPNPLKDKDTYECVPLPEDEELHGFLPLEEVLKPLRFNHDSWDTYGGRVPDVPDTSPGDDEVPREVSARSLGAAPALERGVRAHRLLQLGRRFADAHPDQLRYTEEEGVLQFTATSVGGEQLSLALLELSAAAALAPERDADARSDAGADSDSDSDARAPPPPIVISEADFREKVREKRVGILKPQGSLERAREERALASTQDDPDTDGGEDSSKGEDKKEIRKPRVNIAMAAIMRKQEETNKQVKFVTPPPTPESTTAAAAEAKDQDKPKVIQPKVIKNLANLPLGRKTGGILSLKDKSAGYPHLVNTDPEPPKKTDKEEKKEPRPQGSSQNSQSYQPKRQDMPPSPKWGPTSPPQYEGPRMGFQKNYGIQNAGIAYNPSYPSPPAVNGQGIRLPVVNPKEIDVRTAALQKQNSRQDLFQDGHKFGNYNYQMSGDKKNFLNDLPPRFANQYRYWQSAQDTPLADNKFRDEALQQTSLFSAPPPAWPEPYAQAAWWKPEQQQMQQFPPSYSPSNVQPNFYSPHLNNVTYQNMPFNQMQNQPVNHQPKPDNLLTAPSYLQSSIGQPQLQNLQNVVNSPNFNSSLTNFGSYAPPVGYDSAMYPTFTGKLGYQGMQKPLGYQGKELGEAGLGFGSGAMDASRNMTMKFNDSLGVDNGAMSNLDQTGGAGGAGAGSYSLFSGAPDSAWGAAAHHHPHQSLWSGPGPSPLERLLEQQKQMKPQ